MVAGRRTFVYLSLLLAVVVVAACASSIALLYRASFQQQSARLTETAQSRARLIEAVAQFDEKYSVDDTPGGPAGATLRDYLNHMTHPVDRASEFYSQEIMA